MRSDGAGDVDADGGDFGLGLRFLCFGPDTGQAFNALRGDAELRTGADQDLFQAAYIFDRA